MAMLIIMLCALYVTLFYWGLSWQLRCRGVDKISAMGMVSIFSIPMKIKSRKWIRWERRQLFQDDKKSHGLVVAYRWAKLGL